MRINLLGAPGCGKSTLSANLFSDLKVDGYNIELCHEHVKKWVYLSQEPKSFDQVYLFTKQLRQEDLALRHCKHIITDSPLILACMYAEYNNLDYADYLYGLLGEFDARENGSPINIWIERDHIYQKMGRFQDVVEATRIRNFMVRKLREYDIYYTMFQASEGAEIYKFIKNTIDGHTACSKIQ